MSSLHPLSTTRRSVPSRRVRAGLAVAAVLAVVTPLAAACGAGFNSASLEVVPNSGAGQVGTARINNVWVVVDPGSGAAEVIGAVANTGGDTLSWPSVQVGGNSAQIQTPPSAGAAGSGSAAPASGIPAGQAVSFGEQGQPEIQLDGQLVDAGQPHAGHVLVRVGRQCHDHRADPEQHRSVRELQPELGERGAECHLVRQRESVRRRGGQPVGKRDLVGVGE